MRKISTLFANYTAASSGFSEGQIKDNPGDDTGSAILAAWGTDVLYALYAFIKKFRTGDLSDGAESESASDFCDAFDEALGHTVDGVTAWSSTTTYSTVGELVTYAGMQFVCVNATSNLNKSPLTNPTYWLACPKGAELFPLHSAGRVVAGDCHPIHDYNGAQYLQKFSLGRHRIGDALTGTVFNAWGVHLDGTSVGSGTALETIIEAWHLKALLAPGATGSRVLVDARNRVLRSMGATGGVAPTLGAVQADQMQGVRYNIRSPDYLDNFASDDAPNGNGARAVRTAVAGTSYWYTTNPQSDGINGTPRIGPETRVKGLVVGVPYVVILVPAA